MSPSATLASPASALLSEVLEESQTPVTLRWLEKRLRLTGPAIRDRLASEPNAHRWPDLRRQQRFWHRAPDDFVREQILAVAGQCAVPANVLARTVKKRSHGYPQKLLAALIQQLLREKALRKYPALGRGGALLATEGRPEAYAAAGQLAIQAILDQVAAQNGTRGTHPEDEILAAMARLEPAETAPVSVRELRQALPGLAKPPFDAAALALRDRQRVFLSRHDFPQSLPPAELEALIDGRDGSYYVAITARTE